MRTPKRSLACLLPCIVLLGSVGAASAQDEKDRDPSRPTEIKGEAKVTVHRFKMEKGAIYRLSTKGEGFTPQIRVDEPPSLFGGPPPVSSLAVRGKVDLSQVIFAPTATKEYLIKIDFAPNTDIGTGPHAYTLTIERAKTKPISAAKDTDFPLSENTAKLEQGKAYIITVTGRGFEPDVQIVDATKSKMTAYNPGQALGFGRDAEYVTTMMFMPPKTADYRILVAVGAYSKPRSEPFSYTTAVTELRTELNTTGQLSKTDPRYPARGGPHKVHTVKLQANKKYQIDMMSAAFDAYLCLEDSSGKVLMEDDDGGDGLNARIIFTPTKTDTYRIIATTFDKGGRAQSGGPYTLMVLENANAVPRIAPFMKKDLYFPAK